MSRDQRRTVLSSEQESKHCELVGGPFGSGFAVAGEKATAYTGPEWPTNRREDDGWVFGASSGEEIGLPSIVHTRI